MFFYFKKAFLPLTEVLFKQGISTK